MVNKSIYVLLVISVITNIIIGLVVYNRNQTNRLNKLFFGLSLSIAGWTLTNFLFQILDSTSGLYAVALLSYGFAALIGITFCAFSINLSHKYFAENANTSRIIYAVALIGVILSTIPGVVGLGVSDDKQILTNTVSLILYGLVLGLLFIRGLVFIVMARKKARSRDRNSLSVILLSFATAAMVGLFFNLLMPLLDQYRFVSLGPLGGLILVSGSAYVIVKHKLFDVRLLVARSLAYVFSLGAFALLYGFVVFGLAQLVFNIEVSLIFQVTISLATGFSALTFHYFKALFDKITNNLFYRDAYEASQLFDEYNKALVSTLDIEILSSKISRVIENHLKAEYCLVYVSGSDHQKEFIDNTSKAFDHNVMNKMHDLLSKERAKIIVYDDVSETNSSLKAFLRAKNVAVIANVSGIHRYDNDYHMYMILGPKKSGNQYTSQDVQVIETMANELIIALQNALRFEEIERFNETLQRQVEDATRKLKASNLKLKKLNDTKDDFISMTSHQLRTPLTTIKGYVSLVMDEDAGPVNDAQRKLLTQAFGSAQRLVYMVADLLNVSRLKTGKFVIERTPTDLSTIIDDELGQLKAEASLRNLKLEYKMPKKFPVLPLDETKTRQVIMNFLDNAIYYTPSGGKIRAELVEKDDSVEFLVIDNGIGVPKEERHHLFSKFYRAKNAQRARPDGTGLGLYMAQKVVVAQGGYIIFNSEEGKGSTFGFHFPKDMPEGQVTLPAQAPSGGLDG